MTKTKRIAIFGMTRSDSAENSWLAGGKRIQTQRINRTIHPPRSGLSPSTVCNSESPPAPRDLLKAPASPDAQEQPSARDSPPRRPRRTRQRPMFPEPPWRRPREKRRGQVEPQLQAAASPAMDGEESPGLTQPNHLAAAVPLPSPPSSPQIAERQSSPAAASDPRSRSAQKQD